ncbi:hypothetical protein MALG_03635 [Marinovum algicola DG 898]|nr:hypothetical protein MALG_03635 [Marinovum algicola DG 898]
MSAPCPRGFGVDSISPSNCASGASPLPDSKAGGCVDKPSPPRRAAIFPSARISASGCTGRSAGKGQVDPPLSASGPADRGGTVLASALSAAIFRPSGAGPIVSGGLTLAEGGWANSASGASGAVASEPFRSGAAPVPPTPEAAASPFSLSAKALRPVRNIWLKLTVRSAPGGRPSSFGTARRNPRPPEIDSICIRTPGILPNSSFYPR